MFHRLILAHGCSDDVAAGGPSPDQGARERAPEGKGLGEMESALHLACFAIDRRHKWTSNRYWAFIPVASC